MGRIKVYRPSVGVKLALFTAAVTALVMGVSVIFVVLHLRAEADASAEATARRTSTMIVSGVQGVFESAFDIVTSTHDSLIALRDENIVDRQVYDTLLKRMIVSGTDRYGAWFAWKPDALPVAAGGKGVADASTTYWHQNGMEIFHDQVPQDILDSDLAQVPLQRAQAYLLEPHEIDAVSADPVLVTSFSRPLEKDGTVLGVIGIDLKLDAIREALSSIEVPAGASFSVISDGGVVAMSTNEPESRHLGKSADPVLRQALALAKRGDGSAFVPGGADHGKILRSWSAIRFNTVRNPWYILVEVREPSYAAVMLKDHNTLLLIPLAALLVILLTMLFVVHLSISSPLRSLSRIIAGLGEGLFGFDVPHCSRTDEIGDIARAVERLQESGEKIARLQEENGDAEFARLQKRKEEMNGIANRFSRSIAEVTQALGRVATHIKERSQQVATTSQTAIGRIGDVADVSASAQASLSSVAESTQSLSTAIQAIRMQTRQARTISAKVEARTASTDRSITDLKETVGRIGAVATVIKAVAGQINLIALNATIEAARAGEMGRGFAVVAQEIKVLASKTAVATDEIGRYLIDVQTASQSTDASVAGMHEAFNEMQAVSAEIASALDVQTDATDDIRGYVDSALQGAKNVEQNLTDLGSSATMFHTAADAMLGESDSLSRDASRLSSEVAEFIEFIRVA